MHNSFEQAEATMKTFPLMTGESFLTNMVIAGILGGLFLVSVPFLIAKLRGAAPETALQAAGCVATGLLIGLLGNIFGLVPMIGGVVYGYWMALTAK